MQTSIIIAQILGIVFTIMGLSLFFNKKASIALLEETSKNSALLWTLGLVTVTMGAVLVVFNNTWTTGLDLFITIIGWLTLIKGFVVLVFPETTSSYYKKVKNDSMLSLAGAIAFILGLIMLYEGFL